MIKPISSITGTNFFQKTSKKAKSFNRETLQRIEYKAANKMPAIACAAFILLGAALVALSPKKSTADIKDQYQKENVADTTKVTEEKALQLPLY